MVEIKKGSAFLGIDFEAGTVTSLKYDGYEICDEKRPLFTIGLRDNEGNLSKTTVFESKKCTVNGNTAIYEQFPDNFKVKVTVSDSFPVEWNIEVENNTEKMVEFVDFPQVGLKPLVKNGGNAEILYPFNEGGVVRDINYHTYYEPEYPSRSHYSMFPNMVFSQFLGYMFEGHSLYLGAHDTRRGPKCIDFDKTETGVFLNFRTYCGVNYGENYVCDFPFVWDFCDGSWHDCADIYRDWFEANLPDGAVKARDNDKLPDWYEDSPLVIAYCVRGVHDTDKMDPNALFPFINGLAHIEEIANKTKSKILTLLMHWEGTAPWAPPYVWPPYGGEEGFNEFLEKLHEKGHLLGVYCSGFGWTMKSNLVAEYDNRDKVNDELLTAMCAGPDGKVDISHICMGQRSGYDICVMSDKGKEILDEAYRPLLESNIDYVQILDQNHGGSQYFCYSRDHGHPPAPGAWMTESMTELLNKWQEIGMNNKKLFGCESSCAEPFISKLLYSDNRFELNWSPGQHPVPLFSYLFHEYLRNFQGNQVGTRFSNVNDTMRVRMAYSFIAGDSMTLVLTPFGDLMANWGCHDFTPERLPDKEKALTFAANMRRLYDEDGAKPYLYDGRMIKTVDYECDTVLYENWQGEMIEPVPCVYASAWEKDGKKVQIFANHMDKPSTIKFCGKEITIPAMDGIMVEI